MSASSGPLPDLNPSGRRLSLFSLVCLVVANMIGAGVYTTSGFALSDLGTPHRVMTAWIVGGIIATCGAVGYGLASNQLRESGGEYLFLSRWVHPAVGCVAGWVSLLAGFSGATAMAAVTFKEYLPDAILDNPSWTELSPYFLILGLAALNILRQREGIWTQNFAVALKLILIALVLGAAYAGTKAYGWQGKPLDHATPGLLLSSFAGSLVWISLSYSGFNAAIYVAGESHPQKNRVPLAMLLGTLLVTTIYLLLNAIFVYGPPPELIAGKPHVAVIAVKELAGDSWSSLLRLVILVGLFTSVSSLLIAGSRVIVKMAEDQVLPSCLSGTHQGPRAAIGLQAALALLLVWLASLEQLLGYLGMTLSLCGAATVAAAIWRLEKEGTASQALQIMMGILYVTATLVIAMVAGYHQPYQLFATSVTLAVGFLYWLVTKTRA